MNKDISTLLVANRGEIALRIMRSARAMSLRTVAVYSEIDTDAVHVKFADDAVCIGPAPSDQSYLSISRIIDAARQSGATAVHPGYGFLSENAAFARAVVDEGMVFVGPPADAIEAMSDKGRAKRRMIAAGIPCVPGYEGDDQSDTAFFEAAARICFPVMVKAAAGGGGRGMRLVGHAGDLANALTLARAEAQNAFGDDSLILERAVIRPRHVEIQVMADAHGEILHLGERDCSVQRRHQKVIEESPCPEMTEDLRLRMGKVAVEAARAVGYVGAGTVEFLLDEERQFYFLEMNTRLQVEHPVTEMVTGLDLVELQLRIAGGEKISLTQADIAVAGCAIEARLYAEDPEEGFQPRAGRILKFQAPSGSGVRVDAGVETGGEISAYYDPMIAKVIAHGADRDEARRGLVSALAKTAVFGVQTNRDFLIDALSRPEFVAGQATTAFIGELYDGAGFVRAPIDNARYAAIAALQHAAALTRAAAMAPHVDSSLQNWASAGTLETVVQYEVDGALRTYHVVPIGRRDYRVRESEKSTDVSIPTLDGDSVRISINGRSELVAYHDAGETLWIAFDDLTLELLNLAAVRRVTATAAGRGSVAAPMHGKLVDICVATGAHVQKGDRLAVLEAMKMQHELVAEIDGRVSRIIAISGNQIAARDLILEIEPLVGT